MKAIIEFTLPEEESAFKIHMAANKMYSALSEFSHNRRIIYKYEDKETYTKDEVLKIMDGVLNESGYWGEE